MFHLHRWSAWEQYSQGMYSIKSGRTWYKSMQRRRCKKCGLLRTRDI